MPLPASRRSSNIARSVQVAIVDGNSITVNGDSVAVYPDYRWGDPDEAGLPSTTPDNAFILLTWLQEGAGRKDSSVLQVDVYSRIRAQTDADNDTFGHRARDIADEIEFAFTGTTATGALKACIRIQDYSDPNNPVDTDDYLMVKSVQGNLGEADSRLRPVQENGFWRQTLTFRLQASRDMSGPASIYY